MIGTVLSGYQIIDKIKDGSVGTVWKGRNSFNQDVAIKVISRENAGDGKKLREFQHEGGVAASFDHPGIIKVVKYVNVRPQPYLIMEYFDSENLKYAMWYMPERVAGKEFRILRAAGDALHHMHGRGVVHLDVKPENVLVSATSEVRLIDFSIAEAGFNRLKLFGKKTYGGTPLYMPPEQIRGEKVSPASDQYAFGAMTFELFTKKPPFLGINTQSILEKQLKQPPPSLRTYLKVVPPDVEKFVFRMLAKDPKDRYPDLAAVLAELARLEKQFGTRWLTPAGAAPAASAGRPAAAPAVAASVAVERKPGAVRAPAAEPAKEPAVDPLLRARLEEERRRREARKVDEPATGAAPAPAAASAPAPGGDLQFNLLGGVPAGGGAGPAPAPGAVAPPPKAVKDAKQKAPPPKDGPPPPAASTDMNFSLIT